jgi:hypothetical protein
LEAIGVFTTSITKGASVFGLVATGALDGYSGFFYAGSGAFLVSLALAADDA